MHRGIRWAAGAAAAVLVCHPAGAQTYTFKKVTIIKNDEDVVLAINKHNDKLVLDRPAGATNYTCYLVHGSQRTVIADPNGVTTSCWGLNSANTVVGYYNLADNTAIGFVYNNGTYSDFVTPAGSPAALPTGISDNGIITGYYYPGSGATGFILNGTNFQSFTVPNMTYTYPIGVNNSGQVTVQTYDAQSNLYAYLVTGAGGNPVQLTISGATEVIAQRINNLGQMVGTYYDSAGVAHGFAYDSNLATYYMIDDPGMATTALEDINDKQTLSGNFRKTPTGLRVGMIATGSLP